MGCDPAPVEVLEENGDYLAAVLEEAAQPLEVTGEPATRFERTVLDRRGESPLAVLADAIAAGGPGSRRVRRRGAAVSLGSQAGSAASA